MSGRRSVNFNKTPHGSNCFYNLRWRQIGAKVTQELELSLGAQDGAGTCAVAIRVALGFGMLPNSRGAFIKVCSVRHE
jgi:hypothetical protein